MLIGNKELIRDMNCKLVLQTIFNSKTISRATLAKKLGLTKATISAIVQELLNKNLIIEIGSDDTSLGRKPILLSINRYAGYVISIDLSQETITVLISDLQGEKMCLKRIKTPAKRTSILTELYSLIDNLMEGCSKTPYGLVGITLGIHGVINNQSITSNSFKELSNINLVKELEKQFQTPIYLYNDAQLSLIGEKSYSFDCNNMVNINISNDVRVGILIHNKLYKGLNGYAGEIGHTIIELNGEVCSCGKRGCLNQYLSETALLKKLAHKKGLADVDMKTFSNMYQTCDKDAMLILESYIEYLTICINNVLCSYNPEVIVINSNFVNLFPFIINQIKEKLDSSMPNDITLVSSTLKDSSILLGGISIAIKNFLEIDNIKFHHGNI